MIMTERDRIRERRKLEVIDAFSEDEVLFTNQIAKRIGVVWPVADRILKELVHEERIMGGKMNGYTLPAKKTIWVKLKQVFHV